MFLHLCLLYISIDLSIGQWSIGPFMDVSWYYLVHLAHSGYNFDASFAATFVLEEERDQWLAECGSWLEHPPEPGSFHRCCSAVLIRHLPLPTLIKLSHGTMLIWHLASFSYSDENIPWYHVDMTNSFFPSSFYHEKGGSDEVLDSSLEVRGLYSVLILWSWLEVLNSPCLSKTLGLGRRKFWGAR